MTAVATKSARWVVSEGITETNVIMSAVRGVNWVFVQTTETAHGVVYQVISETSVI